MDNRLLKLKTRQSPISFSFFLKALIFTSSFQIAFKTQKIQANELEKQFCDASTLLNWLNPNETGSESPK
jgi:hypothetical protein